MSELPGAQLRPADYVRDSRIARVVPLLAPDALLDELPLSGGQADVVIRGRRDVQGVLERADQRLLVVVGPCSVHDPEATLEYAARLGALSRELSGELLIAMRVYFEKPRTTTGWKGLINDPHLDGSGDVNAGLRLARRVLLGVLDTGLPVGCEFLDPITPQYIADAVSWGAIGARTTESQIHRQLGSGLSMPVGFKNRTDGNVQVAVDAVRAAAEPHAFAGIDPSGTPAILYTRGNADCHIILRGGKGAPNHDAASVAAALELLEGAQLPRRVMIDLSHDNSGKDPERQPGGGRRGRRADRRRERGDRRRDARVLPRRRAARICVPASSCATASRSPTAASAGSRPSRCWRGWRDPSAIATPPAAQTAS